jgi:hypothetical protein
MTDEIDMTNPPQVATTGPTFTLHEVISVHSTQDVGYDVVKCDITKYDGGRSIIDFGLVPGDNEGYSPAIRQWLIDHVGDYEIIPYTAPTPEELRASMPPVTPRQLRLTLVRSGHSLASVTEAIAALPEGLTKEETAIEFEYATTFERTSVTLLTIASALGMTPEAVDVLWSQAVAA